MQHNRNLFLLSFFLLVFFPLQISRTQPSCEVKCIVKPESLTQNSFEFDILLKAKENQTYGYIKGQYSFSYNTAIRPGTLGGTWKLEIIDSDLPVHKRCSINLQSTRSNGTFVIWGPPDTPDEYIIKDSAYVLIARVKATLSIPFENQPLHFQWRKALPNPFTKLYYKPSALVKRLPVDNIIYSMVGGEILLNKK